MTKLMPCLLALTLASAAVPDMQQARREFHVKQTIPGHVYLDTGSVAGLAEGMKLTLQRSAPGDAKMDAQKVAEIVIVSVATQSALCEVAATEKDLTPAVGDLAVLSSQDAETLQRAQAAARSKRYAQVIGFTSGDPLEEEVREYVPAPRLKEVGRLRGRFGFEFNTLTDRSGTGLNSHQEGAVVRTDWTRIDGTYWNLTGYWRGTWNRRNSGPQQQTLVDLMNRTYQIGLFYNNPRSKYMFGFGRLLLPWASSLSTIDGGYAARKMAKHVTLGVFAGSTPDPTQWDYNPNRQIAGVFTSFEAGSYEKVRWNTTVGTAGTWVKWRPERQFLFVENTLMANNKFSILDNMEADKKNPALMNGDKGAMLSRNFLSMRYQPRKWITFDVNHNYYRGLPTFDLRLLGTGLLDKYLFQGFSGGVRVLPLEKLMIMGNWGRSHKDGDSTSSLNQMYDIAWTRLPWIDSRIDARYSKFTSSFGSGSYQSVSLTRDLAESLRVEVSVGQQDLKSLYTNQSRAWFVNGQLEWNLGLHYFMTSGWLSYRGQVQNYDQLFLTLGYRF